MGFGDGYNTVIRFINVTDLHMTTDNVKNFNIKKILPPLIADIKKFNPHFLLFSGDISNSGKKHEFDEVEQKFLSKIIKDTNLDNDSIMLTPGNHDIDWERLRLINNKIIKGINCSNDLTSFFRNDEKTSLINHTRKDYLDFSRKYRFTESKIIDNDFVSYKRLVFDENKDNKKVNIVSLSTNVLSRVGENSTRNEKDYGNLAIGEYQIQQIIENFKKGDLNRVC